MYDDALLFISRAAPYILKATQSFSVFYPKMTQCTSVLHVFQRAAEVARDKYPIVDLLISLVCWKKCTLKFH